MTEEYQTGANHILEAIYWFINDRAKSLGPSSILYVQFHNYACKNKNRYVLAYMKSLVIWGVLDSIKAAFLPVRHTHEERDRVFSIAFSCSRSEVATTLADFHNSLQ